MEEKPAPAEFVKPVEIRLCGSAPQARKPFLLNPKFQPHLNLL
jgi:hypothetical protein